MPSRRKVISYFAALGSLAALGAFFKAKFFPAPSSEVATGGAMIKERFPLSFQWPTQEPFLFCVHHHDLYPEGTKAFGPEKHLLAGRDMGQDFEGKDGFRMYHGEEVPGFPVHPHRGFETITVVRKGYVDHADSLGAAGRYGEGDVQWMTAGSGVQHSEMFPLLKSQDRNTLELFQIWLNLPKKSKTVPAHFKMLWSEQIPRVDVSEGKASVNLIAGNLGGKKALAPPPDSWAADSENEVMVLLVKLEKGGAIRLPASKGKVNRTLYFFDGEELELNGTKLAAKTGAALESQVELEVKSSVGPAEFLLLQAKPIGEPVVQHGPFVMNSRDDIVRTIQDYQRTGFGGWPWPRNDMVHGDTIERFAKYPDGRIEKPQKT